ncbi:MAG TPA: hypothetical protein VJK08_00350 [Patescibacteria group bacterium]|nr:hypothetical protein [Patescibacteria group bacterium]
MKYSNSSSSYGKRSLLSWIGIYIIVAVVVYGVIYLVYKKINASNSDSGTTESNSIY